MAIPIVQTSGPQVPNVTAATATGPDATTAAGIAQTHGGESSTSSTTFKSMEDLKKKNPKLYNMMMQGIATNICNEMKSHQDRLKKLMREGRNS